MHFSVGQNKSMRTMSMLPRSSDTIFRIYLAFAFFISEVRHKTEAARTARGESFKRESAKAKERRRGKNMATHFHFLKPKSPLNVEEGVVK